MKVIRHDFGADCDQIVILPLSDVHLGSPNCDESLLYSVINEIKNIPYYYTIIDGDFLDMALKTSKSDVYTQTMTPMEALAKCVRILEPIKDKILVISEGNHEQRLIRDVGLNPLYFVACQLGIEDRYAPSMWYLFVSLGYRKPALKDHRITYTIMGYHGSGGGRKLGGKINRVNEMHEVAVADLYVMAHTHSPLSSKGVMYVPNKQAKTLEALEQKYLICNSFLTYENSYAESMGLLPSSNTPVKAVLNGRKKQIDIIL